MNVPDEVVLIVSGLQVPVIGGVFVELGGSAGGALFMQRGPICANTGVICAVMVTSIVVTTPHCPADGVNV